MGDEELLQQSMKQQQQIIIIIILIAIHTVLMSMMDIPTSDDQVASYIDANRVELCGR